MLTILFNCVTDSECINLSLMNIDAVFLAVYEPVFGCDNLQ